VATANIEAVDKTNATLEASLLYSKPTDETSRLQSADVIGGNVWRELFASFPTVEGLDANLAGEDMGARYPGLITAYRPEQNLYDHPALLLDITKLVRLGFRSSTVMLNGTLLGTDKIIHFLHLGRIYHSSYLRAIRGGLEEEVAVSNAVDISAGSNLFLSENALLGMAVTGIRSNADLASDYAGFKFYRNLTEEVRIGTKRMLPMLVREGLYWRLNDHMNPYSDFFTRFITPHWNEALNPNVYAVGTDTWVRTMMRARCPDLLDWYRDDRGERRNQQQFLDITEELSTFYGAEYGYEDEGDETVSIATTCFDDGVPGDVDGMPRPIEEAEFPAEDASGGMQEVVPDTDNELSPRKGSAAPVVDRLGRTQLWWAARNGRIDDIVRLLAQGVDPNAADFDGEGPVHSAARSGHAAILETLLSHGADADSTSLYGTTPLHLSARGLRVDAVRVLLENGADANARDDFGYTALHDAALRSDSRSARLLLAAGADPGAIDDNGTSPLHLATRAGSEEMVQLLSSRGAGPETVSSE